MRAIKKEGRPDYLFLSQIVEGRTRKYYAIAQEQQGNFGEKLA